MAIYRNADKNEYDKIINLCNEVFKLDFEKLLPKTFYKEGNVPDITKVAQDENGNLIAEVCVLPQTVNIGDYSLNSNYLGTVSVHENNRGEGHMIKLMNMFLDEMQGKYDMTVLGGRRQRYEYFGYTYGGEQWEYVVNIHNIRHALKEFDSSAITFKPLKETESGFEFAYEYNKNRKVNVVRDKEIIDKILTSYRQTPIAVLKNDNIIGYLLSSNENNDISEFVLTDYKNTKKVIKAFFETYKIDKTVVVLPQYETELHMELSSFAESYRMIPCCMFNILNFANVIKAYLSYKNDCKSLSYGKFSAIMDNQPLTVTVDEKGVTVENSAESGAVVLDKMDAQKLLLTPSGRYLNLPIPKDWFPLPLFWYYVDCF